MNDNIGYPVIRNIKIHFTLNSITKRKLFGRLFKEIKRKKSIKFYKNFLVLKSDYTYIIFKNGTVNVTGLKNLIELTDIINKFSLDFKIPKDLLSTDVIIDNITGSGSFEKNINLRRLQLHLSNQCELSDIQTKLNFSYFPALICKDFKKGTILIFGNGNYTIVGSKNQADMINVYLKARNIINKLK